MNFFIKSPSLIFRKAASFYTNYYREMKAWKLWVVGQLEFHVLRDANNSPRAPLRRYFRVARDPGISDVSTMEIAETVDL